VDHRSGLLDRGHRQQQKQQQTCWAHESALLVKNEAASGR